MDPKLAADALLQFYQDHPNHLDVFVNALLVDTGIRRAFLIQPIDYKEPVGGPSVEWEREAPVSTSLLRSLQSMFPQFKFVHMNQGILVLRQETQIPFDVNRYTNIQLGELLSYPCPGDITKRRNLGVHYRIIFHRTSYHLFAVICGEINPQVHLLADQIQGLINTLNANLPAADQLTFRFKIEPIISPETVIQSVLEDQITPSMRREVRNILYNAYLALLNILQDHEIIDLYDPELRQFLLSVLLRYQSNNRLPNILRMITNPEEKKKVRQALFDREQNAIVNILTRLYGIQIDPEYLEEARQIYFKP
jgi:hypothetical protein